MQLSTTILISTLLLLNALGSLGQIYVDPLVGSDTTGTGAQLTPFKTLTAAVNSLTSATSTIIVVNDNGDVEVDLLTQATISTTVTIQASNTLFHYVISLDQFDEASISTDSAAIRVTGGSLTVKNPSFSPKSTVDNLQAFFKVYNAKFTLQNAIVADLQGLPELVQTIGTTQSNSKATLQTIQHTNSSAAFNFVKGQHTASGITIINNVAAQALFTVSQASILTISNTYVTGGSALVFSAQGAMVDGTNVTVINYNGNLVYANAPTYISFASSAFRDITVNSPNPFLYITGTTLGSMYTHPLEDVIFDNIVLNRPVILVDQQGASLSIYTTSMNNIVKTQSLTEASCIGGQNNCGITVYSSTFTSVNTNCIVMNTSGLVLENNVFDNSNLPSTTSNPDGISWVSYNDATLTVSPGNFFKINSNSFLNNTLAPLNGGALKITGTFSGFMKMTSNIYQGNEAQVNGGAIYVENYNEQVTATGESFTENKATQGAALYFVDNASGSGVAVSISNSTFTNNVNSGSGSVVAINPARFSGSGNTFVGNV